MGCHVWDVGGDWFVGEQAAPSQDAEAGVGGVNGHCGFVTFNDVRDARVAMNVKSLGGSD